MSALSDLLRDKQRGRSTRTLRDNALRRDRPIGHATIGLYLSDDHPRPSEATLKALAAAFGVSLKTLRRAAGMADETAPFTLPPEADRLTRRQRTAVVEVVRAMLEPDPDREVTISTQAVLVDDESEEAVGARPESAGRSRAPRSARRGRPRAPRPPTPSDEGRSR